MLTLAGCISLQLSSVSWFPSKICRYLCEACVVGCFQRCRACDIHYIVTNTWPFAWTKSDTLNWCCLAGLVACPSARFPQPDSFMACRISSSIGLLSLSMMVHMWGLKARLVKHMPETCCLVRSAPVSAYSPSEAEIRTTAWSIFWAQRYISMSNQEFCANNSKHVLQWLLMLFNHCTLLVSSWHCCTTHNICMRVELPGSCMMVVTHSYWAHTKRATSHVYT